MRPSRIFAIVLAVAACAASGMTQTVIFEEDFDNGIPANWSNLQLNWHGDPWFPRIVGAVNGSPDVYHEWWCNYGWYFRDNILLSPPIDLSGLTQVTLHCEQHQLLPQYRVYNKVEVTTNGGGTYTVIYDETGTWSGPGTIDASMDAYAGLPSVQIAFHYKGSVANEWSIDNVKVTTLSVTLGQPAGPGTPVSILNSDLTPGSEYYNLFSLDICPGGVGTGPLLGLCSFTPQNFQFLLSQLNFPVGTPALHFVALSNTALWGPFALPPLTIDALCFEFTGGIIASIAPVTRFTIQ